MILVLCLVVQGAPESRELVPSVVVHRVLAFSNLPELHAMSLACHHLRAHLAVPVAELATVQNAVTLVLAVVPKTAEGDIGNLSSS